MTPVLRDSQDDSLQLTDSEVVNELEYSRLPQNLITSLTLLEGCEDDALWSVTNGVIADNTTAGEFVQGAQSIKVTTNAGVTANFNRAGISWALAYPERDFCFWYYCHDYANFQYSQLQLGQGGDVVNRAYAYPEKHDGWNLIRLLQDDLTLAGAFSWDTLVDYCRLRVTPQVAVQANLSCDYFFSSLRRPALVITFDDWSPTVYTIAYDYMNARHAKGTFYVTTDQVDGVNRISLAQLTEMNNAGWDIANHTDDHTDLTTVAQVVAQAHLADAKTALDGWGFTRASNHVAYPGGAYNDTVVAAMVAENMLTGRTVVNDRYPVLPFDQPYRIELGQSFGNTLTLAAAKTWLDGVVSRDEIGIALFHSLVVAPANLSEWGIDDFKAFIDYAVSLNIPIITISELYALQSGSVMVRMPG